MWPIFLDDLDGDDLPELILRLPLHVGDLVERSEVLLRIAMAIETPPHAQRFLLVDDLHLVDAAVGRSYQKLARRVPVERSGGFRVVLELSGSYNFV